MRKPPSPRAIKIHRSYTVDELAEKLDVHENTVRNWIKKGLTTVDESRPTLILGSSLREYLEAKRTKNKRRLQPGEIYCVRCRNGKAPLERFATIERNSHQITNLVGVCPDCDTLMYRRISLARWQEAVGDLDVSFPEALEQLGNGNDPSPNC